MATQLEIQQAINKALEARTDLLEAHSRLVRSQLADLAGLNKAWTDANASQADIIKTIKDMRDALEEVGEQAEETGDDVTEGMEKPLKPAQALNKVLLELDKKFPGLAKGFKVVSAAALGFVDGFVKGLVFVEKVLKRSLGLILSVGKAFTDIGLSIIKIPFNVLNGLVEASNKMVQLMEAVARATEEVREQFGELSSGAGKAVIDTARDIGTGFEQMGLGGYRIFGSLDERIEAVNKAATAMGSTFERFKNEMVEDQGASLLLQKGLGIADEQMATLAQRAIATGTTWNNQFRMMTNIVAGKDGLAKKFGLSAKLMSRDMSVMMADVKNFGNLSAKQLGVAVAYTKKLGIEVKDLASVSEKFNTFESAAEGAAMMSQAFGANVDAVKMMKSQNPADQVDELRRAFLATGKSADQLSKQELQLLAQSSGMTEQTALLAFSQKNAGVSMDVLNKKARDAEKQQMSTAQAVQAVQESIKRAIKPFQTFVGFFKAFADGFAKGIFNGKTFMQMLGSVHKALHQTTLAGMALGKLFLEIPGVKETIKAVTDFFNTTDRGTPFMKMITNVKDAFLKFFKTIKDGPDAVRQLFGELQLSFESFKRSAGGEKLIKWGASFAGVIGNMIAGAIEVISIGAVEIMKTLADILTGKNKLQDFKSAGGQIVDALITPIVEEFKNGQALKEIIPAFKQMLKDIWAKHKKDIIETVMPIGAGIGLTVFGSAFANAAGSVLMMVGNLLMGMLAESIVTWITAGPGVAMLTSVGSSIVAAITSPFVLIPAAIAATLGAAVGVSKGMDKFNNKLIKEFDKTESQVGASVAGIVDTLSFGLLPDSFALKVGEFFATGTKMFLDALESLPAGHIFSMYVKELIDSAVNAMKSLGDLVMAIFDGNSSRINQAAVDFGSNFTTIFLEWVYTLGPMITAFGYSLMIKVGELLVQGFIYTLTELLPRTVKLVLRTGEVILGFIAGVFYKLGDIAAHIPVFGYVLQVIFGIIGSIFEGIGQFAGALGDKIAVVIKWFDGIKTAAAELWNALWEGSNETLDKMWKYFTDIFNPDAAHGVVMGMFWGFDKAMRNFVLSVSKHFNNALEWIYKKFGIHSPSTVFESIGQNIIAGLANGLVGIKDLFINTAKNALKYMKNVFGIHSDATTTEGIGDNLYGGLANSKLTELPELLKKVSVDSLNAMSAQFKNFDSKGFKKLQGDLGVIGDVIGSLNDINTKSEAFDKDADKISARITNAIMTLEKVFSPDEPGYKGNITRIRDLAAKLAGDYNANSVLNATTSEIFSSAASMLGDVDRMNNTVKGLLPNLSKGLFSDIKVPTRSVSDMPVVKAIARMVEEVNLLENSLKTLGEKPIDLDLRLEKLGKSLGLKNNQFKVERKNLNMTLNVNVTMDADKLAKVLLDTKYFVSEGALVGGMSMAP